MNTGLLSALFAYAIWGLFPLFWRLLQALPATQITAHRIIWSWLVLTVVIVLSRQWRNYRDATNRRVLLTYTLSAVLISINWIVYIWAVNANHIVETSLGYFINPLISVFFGTVFFNEHLRPLHWLSLFCASIGVIYLTWHYGRVPWIALVLATTFASYGLVKKLAPLKSLFGLTLETSVLVVPAIVYLLVCEQNGTGTLLHSDLRTYALLFIGGIITAGPLLLFATAAQRIPLSLIGILQYIAPTIQILLGIFFFHEPFSSVQLTGFSLVWIALGIFVIDGFLRLPKAAVANDTTGS
jgi:chloramphenicol-sensitive protein RarD